MNAPEGMAEWESRLRDDLESSGREEDEDLITVDRKDLRRALAVLTAAKALSFMLTEDEP